MKSLRFRILAASLALVAFLAPAGDSLARDRTGPRPKAKPPVPGEIRVLVLGVNDLHGQLEAGRKVGGRPAGSAGALAAWLQSRREAHDGPTFLALAGDCVGASPASSALLQDEPTVSLLNMLADDSCRRAVPAGAVGECNVVAALGNHEFDEGWEEMLRLWRGGRHERGPFLEERWTGARFPVLCSNVVKESSRRPLMPRSVVLDADGVRVGFIGAVVRSTPSLVTPSGVKGLRFLDEADSINAEARRLLKRGVQALVVVIHEGGKQDAYEGWTKDDAGEVRGAIARIVERLVPEIDLVVSGHTHQFTNARMPREAGGPVLVTQAWAAGTAFSEAELVIDGRSGDVTSSRARIVTAWADEGPGATPHAGASALAETARARVASQVERVIGQAGERISRKPNDAGESALGNLVADAQRAITGADVALMNPGGLRADIEVGEVTWGDLFSVQPFGNVLVTVELTGKELLEVLEPQGAPDAPRVLACSGVTWAWDPDAPRGRRVVEARVSGEPVDAARTYRVTVNSFMAGGGDDLTTLTFGRNPVGGPLDLDALVQHVRDARGILRGRIEGRVTTR